MDETRPDDYVSMICLNKYIEIWIFSGLTYFDIGFSFELQVSYV